MPSRSDKVVRGYVTAWVVAGAAALVATTVFYGLPAFSVAALVLFVLTSLSEFIGLDFDLERGNRTHTLLDAAIVIDILLLPPTEALLVVTLAIGTTQIIRRRERIKLAYNVGNITVGTAAAIGVLHLVPMAGPTINDNAVVGALLGMAAYSLINVLAISVLLSLITGQKILEAIREHGPLTLASLVGNSAVGILTAGLWITRPELLPFVLAPVAAVHLSYRGSVRTNALLAQLRAEHERLDRVVIGTSDGILLLDATGRIELWNRALEAMTGIPAAEAEGQPVQDLLTPEIRKGLTPVEGRWLMDNARPAEPRALHDAVLTDRDGIKRFVSESHTFLFDDRGRCVGDVVVVHDVTRQRELDAMKGDFVARVSHELRTPLTPIRGFAEVLVKRGPLLSPEQRAEAARSIAERAARMTALVEDLLLVARLDDDTSRSVVDPVILDLTELVAISVGRFRQAYPHRNIHLFSAPGTSAALADPDRTAQILTNLVDNALRYSGDDSSVEVQLDQNGDDVVISVSDHGPGIPRDKQQAIFERFHRLEDPLRMRTGGVGLGLFIARKLAEAMHGSLEVESTLGEGSRFTLRLPSAEPTRLLPRGADDDGAPLGRSRSRRA